MSYLPLGLIFLFFLGSRLFPYFQNNVPLGYDSGLYLYLFKQYSQIPFPSLFSLPSWIVGMYQPGIPVLAKILTIFIDPGGLLIPIIIFSQVLLFLSVYLLAKKLWNQKTALWTVFIFTYSALQYHFYSYYYLKNAFALSFLLFTFYFLLSRSYWAVLFTVLVLYFHQQTALFLLSILVLMFVFNKNQRRYLATVISTSALIAAPYYIFTFDLTVLPLIKPILAGFLPQPLGGTLGIYSGSFYNPQEALLFTLPYLPLSLWSLWLLKLQRKTMLITLPFLLALFIVVIGPFFSRRFIPFLDLFLILLAGYSSSIFFQKRKVLTVLYIICLITFSSIYVHEKGKPLILDDELNEIKQLSKTEQNASVLVTDQAYMPWVYGWSDRRTIAPGFGENDIYWTTDEWYKFWLSNSRETERELLSRIPKPLYIYKGDRAEPSYPDFSGECFEKINWRTYKFICD